jgi:hypothetical protein
VTRRFCDKIAQYKAKTDIGQILYHNFFSAKNCPKIWACYLCKLHKIAKRLKHLNWRKFAQSGHPAWATGSCADRLNFLIKRWRNLFT